MGYLNDFIYYGSGSECPPIYLQWSGLSLLGAILGRKIYTMHGRYRVHTKIYTCLVGDAGSGKSTAKNQAKQFLRLVDKDYLISSSFQSHQDIMDQMANSPDAVKTWKDKKTGKIIEYRVFYGVCNELASLLSTDKTGMVTFLTDVFDDEQDEFTTGYKGMRMEQPERKQVIVNPYVSILACAVPKWFMGSLKLDLFDGGLGRRLIVVYSNKTELVPEPQFAPGSEATAQRIVAHLAMCKSEAVQGEVLKTPNARKWWHEWYTNPKRFNQIDPILNQFHQTKHIQVLKVALLLAMCETPFTMEIEDVHLQCAVTMLDDLEPQIARLTAGIGRNELAGVGSQVIEFIARTGGMQTEVNVRKAFWRHAQNPEFEQIVNHYIAAGELFRDIIPGENGQPARSFYFTAEGYDSYKRLRAEVVARKLGVPAASLVEQPPASNASLQVPPQSITKPLS